MFGVDKIGYVFDSIGDCMQDGMKFSQKGGDLVYAGMAITLDAAYKEVA